MVGPPAQPRPPTDSGPGGVRPAVARHALPLSPPSLGRRWLGVPRAGRRRQLPDEAALAEGAGRGGEGVRGRCGTALVASGTDHLVQVRLTRAGMLPRDHSGHCT